MRQGDPLSPLLFNLAGEDLNRMLVSANKLGMFKGIKLNDSSDDLTHSQYDDNTILFIRNDIMSVSKVKEVLQCFQLLSGLKINFQKSKIYSFSRNQASTEEFASILGCKMGSWPLVYLGSHIGTSSRKAVFWKPLIQKFQGKLSSWKRKCLNPAGKASIIRSTLNSLRTYWFSLYSIPSGVCQKIESIRRIFFWGSSTIFDKDKKRKLHSLAWDKVCRSIRFGGLGLSSLKSRNMVLLCKWLYKWHSDRPSNWNKWIREKYKCPVGKDLCSSLGNKKLSNFMKDLVKIQNTTWLGSHLKQNNLT